MCCTIFNFGVIFCTTTLSVKTDKENIRRKPLLVLVQLLVGNMKISTQQYTTAVVDKVILIPAKNYSQQ
jgi:hypothetical protein